MFKRKFNLVLDQVFVVFEYFDTKVNIEKKHKAKKANDKGNHKRIHRAKLRCQVRNSTNISEFVTIFFCFSVVNTLMV